MKLIGKLTIRKNKSSQEIGELEIDTDFNLSTDLPTRIYIRDLAVFDEDSEIFFYLNKYEEE